MKAFFTKNEILTASVLLHFVIEHSVKMPNHIINICLNYDNENST